MFRLRRQVRLDKFLRITERRKEECRINTFHVKVFIENSNLHLYIEKLEVIGSPNCKERLYLELVSPHASYLFNIGYKISRKNRITSWLPLVKPLAKDEKNLKEVKVRLLLMDDGVHLIPLTKFETIKVRYRRPKELESKSIRGEGLKNKIPVIEIPSPEACKHKWITVQIFRNMRGDIVAELQYCRICGLTRRIIAF